MEKRIFKNTVSLVDQATKELRRMCKGLRPPLLDDLGIEPAVRLLVNEFEGLANVNVHLHLELEEIDVVVPKDAELCTYRILQESLTNVSRHAKATDVKIELTATPENLTLSVEDSGEGFDMTSFGELQGWGLQGMRERANLVGGTLEIDSATTQGTRVIFRVPLRIQEEEGIP